MSAIAARLHALSGIRAYFKANGISTAVLFGPRERGIQLNQGVGGANRIVLVPGRLPNGDDGDFSGAAGPGGNPRKLVSQEIVTTLSLWAGVPAPGDNRNDEALEQAIDDMKENVISAIQSVLMQAATIRSPRWNLNPLETRFGAEYLIELAISGTYRALEQGVPAYPTPIVHRGTETIPAPTGK